MSTQYLPDLQPIQHSAESLTVKDLATAGYRHRRPLVVVFGGIMLASFAITLLMPRTYEAHLRILVKNGRVDPVVSPDPNVVPQQSRDVDLEEALNSEAELLKSRDLLERVATTTGLDREIKTGDRRKAVALATQQLAHDLRIEPVSKTNIIALSYRSPDPKQAAEVLNTLASQYLQKHVELRRTQGEHDFFSRMADEYRTQLVNAEAKLAGSGQIAPNQQRELTVEKYTDSLASLAQTKASIQETEKRIAKLQNLESVTPARVVTQTRRADNQALLQQMKSTLLNLQLKRTELLAKYQPSYRPVQEVEKEIGNTEAALAREEGAPARDQTTDQNPTHTWIDQELAKANADLVTLKAREAALARVDQDYETRLQQLQQQSMTNDELQRAVNMAKDNYSLYARKAEEERISEALDRNRILNVAIAENATEPVLPARSRLEYLFIGTFVALASCAMLLVVAHRLDSRYYRTPDEVVRSLQVPVLAALPPRETQPGKAA